MLEPLPEMPSFGGSIDEVAAFLNSLLHPPRRTWRGRAGCQFRFAAKAAATAWRQFTALAEKFPADQAASLWRDVHAQSAVAIHPNA